MRVLVLDESSARAELLRDGLSQAGFEVTAPLTTPLALLRTIEALAPDVIVIDTGSIKEMVEVSSARFEEIQNLRGQIAKANLQLSERKLVERAKGILMKTRGLEEEAAYRALRRMAMDKNRRIGEVARGLIEMADLLG